MSTNGEITMANGTDKLYLSNSKPLINNTTVNSNKKSTISLYDQSSDEDTLNNTLLDKIRKRSNQSKTWTDLAKLSRTFLYEKRHPLITDQQEKIQLQRCLDTIQKSIKVTSLQSMIERLETITRQLGLKFMSINQVKDSSNKNVFISSDMFYVEVGLDPTNGYVNDVKIAHSAEPVSCPELTKVLREADFVEFNKHLNGLIEIYRLSADKNKKSKAYVALNALEQDLNLLSKLQSSINEPNNLVHKSPVGILEPRKGGRPMKLTYFISPYDLIDEKRRVSFPLSIDIITDKRLGYSATVCLQNQDKNCYKLQTQPLISISQSDGKSYPRNAAINNTNSISLPACFALKLSESLPLSLETIEKIKQVTKCIDIVYDREISPTPQPLISLLAKKMLSKKEFNKFRSVNDPFYVELPDQYHTYYFNSTVSNIMSYEVTSIPFIHPTSVPQILMLLRKQVLFNVLIGSCIRQVYRKDELKSLKAENNNSLMFEITALSSITSITVSFEHPVEESLATIDFDLEELINIKAKLYDSQTFNTYISDEHISLVMQRCFSIPVTMRSVIKKCQDKVALIKEELRKKQAQMMQIRQNEIQSENNSTFYNQPQQMISNDSSDHSLNCNNLINNKFDSYQLQHTTPSMDTNIQGMLQPNSNQRANYQQQSINYSQQQQTKSNTMLMTMLSDVPAANSQAPSLNNQPNNYFASQQQQQFNMNNQQTAVAPPKVKRQRKRKNQDSNIKSPSSYGRSPKRKISEDEFARDLPTPGSDYMDNSYDYHSVGSNQPLSRPSSTTSSNSLQFSSIKQDLDTDSNSQQLLSDLHEQNRNFSFLDNSNTGSSFEFNKRKRSLDNSDEMMFQDNFGQTKFSGLAKGYSPSIKSPSEKKIGTLETMLKDSVASSSNVPKKERKQRKKTEIDPNKNVSLSSVMVSNMQLMPPPSPMITGITASSPTSSTMMNTYGFVDLDSNSASLGSPALRPITLNVKPSAMNTINTGNVNVTGVKANEKNLANKLKQGSPKTVTEIDSFSMPNYSPKSSPKTPKQTKQNKANTQLTSGSTTTSPKSAGGQQSTTGNKQQSNMKFKSLNTAGQLVSAAKVSSSSSPISISPPTNASPQSPKQNPLLSSKNAMATIKKNSKGSLNAVIDKLRTNATSSNNDDSNSGSSTMNSLQLANATNIEVPFKNDQLNKTENKLITSQPAGGLSSKLNESKIKYNRPEFALKQSGALKFTVTKTKLPSVEQTKTATKNASNKPTQAINKVSQSSSGTSSLFAQQKQSANKTSAGLKRQLSTNNFKSGIQQGNKSGSTTKSFQPESADQILEAALPKIQLDKLPKIPKTLNSQFNSQQNQQANQQTPQSSGGTSITAQQSQVKNTGQAKFLQQQQQKLQQQQQNLLKQQLNSDNNNLGNNNFRKYVSATGLSRGNEQLNNQTQQDNNIMQIARTTTNAEQASIYSQNISTSVNKASVNNDNQQAPENESQNKESNKSINKQSFTNQSNKSTSNLSAATTTSSVTTIANPSSTPSSPMECNVIPDVYQNLKSPPLIPTEIIEETQPAGSSFAMTSNLFPKTKAVFELPSTLPKKQSSTALESAIAKLAEKHYIKKEWCSDTDARTHMARLASGVERCILVDLQ